MKDSDIKTSHDKAGLCVKWEKGLESGSGVSKPLWDVPSKQRSYPGDSKTKRWGAKTQGMGSTMCVCVCVCVCVCMCTHASTCMNEHVCPHSTNMVEMGGRLDLCPGVTVIDHKQLEWMENQVWCREEPDMNDRSWRALYVQQDEAVNPRPLGLLPEIRFESPFSQFNAISTKRK